MRLTIKVRILLFLFLAAITSAWVSAQEISTEWTKHEGAIFTGQFFVASDPTVIRDGDLYRMVYSCLDFFEEARVMICEALSHDGILWAEVETGNMVKGLILRGRHEDWDDDLEGAFLLQTNDQYLLYYSGYEDESNVPAKGFPAALAIASSSDGVHFERISDEPVLPPTAGWYDNDAVYSPAIVPYEGGYAMVYDGHCYTNCDYTPGVSLLGATSPDGITWMKLDEPVMLAQPNLEWADEGVAEPALIEMEDGSFTLFFTGLHGEERVLGVARSETP